MNFYTGHRSILLVLPLILNLLAASKEGKCSGNVVNPEIFNRLPEQLQYFQ
jgi:hypothetical protein